MELRMRFWNSLLKEWSEGRCCDKAKAAHENSMIFLIGKPNDGFAQYFIGQSFLAPVSTEQVGIFNVTFEPGCRNNWHVHHADKGGDCINIPVGVKHWHGAAPDSWFSHLAVEVPGENGSNEWLEPVDDEQYGVLK